MDEMEKIEKLSKVAEGLDWNVDLCFGKNSDGSSQRWAEFEKYSPAGEDFVFTVNYDDVADFVRQVRETYDDFDPDLHGLVFRYSIGTCKKCGSPLFPSDLPEYESQCFCCDEDFYGFEQKTEGW